MAYLQFFQIENSFSQLYMENAGNQMGTFPPTTLSCNRILSVAASIQTVKLYLLETDGTVFETINTPIRTVGYGCEAEILPDSNGKFVIIGGRFWVNWRNVLDSAAPGSGDCTWDYELSKVTVSLAALCE